MPLTPAQRAAQRSLVGLIRAGSAQLDSNIGLRIWRAAGSEEWQVGVDEITDHLATLEIPHTVALVRRTTGRAVRAGFEVRVAWDDLDSVLRWAPSLQPLIDAVGRTEGPGTSPPAS